MNLEQEKLQFYALIGEIALLHAGVEQNVKNVLICDWGVPEVFFEDGKEVIIEKHFGEKLKKRFFREIRKRVIPQNYFDEYKILYKRFSELSDQRNAALKAIYAFDEKTSKIYQIHQKNHGKFNESKSFEEMVSSWMPKVDLTGLRDLRDNLQKMRGEFLNIQAKIFTDKIKLHGSLCCEIGKTYPGYAFKNPYLYQESLRLSQQDQS